MNAINSSASAERYRVKASEMRAKARQEPRPELKAEYDRLAASYLRLAEQADRNSANDVVYEPPARQAQSDAPPRQQQQQQQRQANPQPPKPAK